jgi:hypothetical protein
MHSTKYWWLGLTDGVEAGVLHFTGPPLAGCSWRALSADA